MNYLDLFKHVSAARNAVKIAHQLALSNRLATDKADKLFAAFDKKAFSFEKAVVETFDIGAGEYKYNKPGMAQPNTRVTEAVVLGKLAVAKNDLGKLQDSLKASKFKLVNKAKNETKNLTNGARSVLTKAIGDVNKLSEIFTVEAEEEAAD